MTCNDKFGLMKKKNICNLCGNIVCTDKLLFFDKSNNNNMPHLLKNGNLFLYKMF